MLQRGAGQIMRKGMAQWMPWSRRRKCGSAQFDNFVDIRHIVIADPKEKFFKESRVLDCPTDFRIDTLIPLRTALPVTLAEITVNRRMMLPRFRWNCSTRKAALR